MKPRFDLQVTAQVSKMYYNYKLTQDEIAKKMDFSRSLVSLILTEAREYGIVEIIVKDPTENNKELSEHFISKFDLKDCYVVPTSITEIKLLTRIIAAQGAAFSEKLMKSDTTVGIAWGTTCFEFMEAFENRGDLNNINVVPLIGASNRHASEYQLSEIVRIFAEKLNGTPSYLHAPAIAETIEDQSLYMKSSGMQAIIKKWRNLDLAIISAGATPEYFFSSLKPDAKHMLEIIKNSPDRAVGDICGRRYNLDGDFLNNDYNRRVLGINENSIRNTEKVICVASGEHKVFSIVGALRTGLIHYLVIDENTALNVKEIIGN